MNTMSISTAGLRAHADGDVLVIASGIKTMRALEAAATLQRDGIDVVVVHSPPPDAFVDAGALPTLHDRYGISTEAMCRASKEWL